MWRDERFWKIAFQIITLAIVIALFFVLFSNLARNLEQLGISFGFRFMFNEAGFSIGEDLVNYQPQDTYLKVMQAGLINSLRVIAVGITLATIVGIIAGVASFSENWLVHKISRVYVGLVRNVPLLLQLFFWYFAIYFQLPRPQDQISLGGWLVMSKRGVSFPGPSFSDQNWLGVVTLIGAVMIGGLLWKLVNDVLQPRGFSIGRLISGVFALVILAAEVMLIYHGLRSLIAPEVVDGEAIAPVSPAAWVLVLVGLAIATVIVLQQRTRVMVEQGDSGQPQLVAIAIMVAVFVLIILFGLGWKTPEVLEGGGSQGGLRLSLEYAAAVTGLTFYTGAFIAEIVRAGIQSVSKGQWEAARSLGLASTLSMRLVVFPQALRVIIPPLNSEYMNLAKNTTLAFAIGYPELFSVSFTALNQTGRAVEVILLIMATYLVLTLLISVGMNQMNSLVQFKER